MVSRKPAASPISENQSTRRAFLGRSLLAAGAVTFGAPAFVSGRNLNEKLNIAMIACGGRGAANMRGVASENIVALCDVAQSAVDRAAEQYPMARKEVDFRRLFDRHQEFDASEMTLASYMVLRARGEAPFTAIPAFLARTFIHGGLFVHAKSGIRKPKELIQKVIDGDAPIHQSSGQTEKKSDKKENPIYRHLMNGVSYMVPFIVIGGLLIAVALLGIGDGALRPALRQLAEGGDSRKARRFAWLGFILTIIAIGLMTRALYAVS